MQFVALKGPIFDPFFHFYFGLDHSCAAPLGSVFLALRLQPQTMKIVSLRLTPKVIICKTSYSVRLKEEDNCTQSDMNSFSNFCKAKYVKHRQE